MINTKIIIPADDYERVYAFYRDVMSFCEEHREFLLPTAGVPVSLHLIHLSEECKRDYPPKRNYPIFWYRIQRNFLTYCRLLYQKGARLGDIYRWQGGFYASIYDPEQNMFGLWCETAEDSGDDWDDAAQVLAPLVRVPGERDLRECAVPHCCSRGGMLYGVKTDASTLLKPAVNIVLPVSNMKRSRRYYRDVLGFREEGGLFFLPTAETTAALELKVITEKDVSIIPSGKKFMSFEYEIERNFLSYFMGMFERGAVFDTACEHPGGYFGRVSDPDGNEFEIHCSSFEEDDEEVDPWQAPFYFRY